MRDAIIKHEFSSETIKYDDYIAGLAKGLFILEAFGTERQRLNVTQTAERTNLTRTAARRYLKTLNFLGYLESDDNYYWLTPKVLKFSSSYLSTARLPKVAQPILNILAEKTALVYSVVVIDNNDVVPVARSIASQTDNFRVSPFGIHLGNRIPVHASSTGKIFLAQKSQAEQSKWIQDYEFKRFTSHTIIDQEQFTEALSQVSKQAFCISSEEYELGVTAVAVPIVNQHGDVIAAVNAVAAVSKVSEYYLKNTVVSLLQEASKQIRDVI